MQTFQHVSIPPLSSLYILDGRLPTLGSSDYNRIPLLRRHKWTAAEKQVLYLLNGTYKNPAGELWRVFNAFFKEGRERWVGPRRRAWETMRGFNMDPVRYRVELTGAEARRVRGEIERVAVGVGVRLLGKGGPLTPVRGRGKRRGPGSVSSVGDGLHSVRSTSPEQGTVRRKLFDADDSAKRATVTTNGLLTPPPTVKKNGRWKSEREMDIPVPSIAFRAFNHQSQGLNGAQGFVAGTFVHVNAIPEEPPAEPEYIQELWRHLEKQHSGPTPFISVSPYLMRVVMHAFRRDRELGQRTEWSVAVIALGKVRRADVRAVWGVGAAAGWNARRAFGEWVVHGSIPASNVLCVVPLARLVATMSATTPPFHIDELRVATNLGQARAAMAARVNRKLTFEDGVAVGRVLLCLGIPKRYVDEVTGAMVRDWRFPKGAPFAGRKKEKRKGLVVGGGGGEAWRGNGGFLRGREEGFGGTGVVGGFWELGEGVKEEEEENGSHCGAGVFERPMVEDDAAGNGAPVWGFLEELEEAAFGVAGSDGLIHCGWGEDEAAFRVKEESPDCLALDCPEG